jgi:ATP-dependent RNA helicase SUPV3L1/SUV3
MNELLRPPPSPLARSRTVTAVLGPTNTGKTHYAIERMLAYGSGIIGLPLRLLAREVYGRVVARVGEGAVALITGEEKIKPESPRYWVATVEAMPRDLDVDFVAIDEVQLAADLERGHVFTDRLLHHRGRHETLLLGAGTIRGIVQSLLPSATIVQRPRLSRLTYAGQKKITRLPPRSAAVAFSAAEVYAIAELIRRQRGGAAVVLGALSPRTRNAQVALYQSGEVDFLVATDAIGMGLNLDVEHVAFASDRKFDGYHFRALTPAEMGQIAGRAGRHLNDGTFGVTGRVDPLDADMVQRLESHDFEPIRVLQWRNPVLDMRSLDRLRASLAEAPNEPGLVRAPAGEDMEVIEVAAREDDVRDLCATASDVARLWETAQVPDYRRVSPAAHAELCLDIFRFLQRRGRIADDWFERQIKQSDRTDGDIDTLSTRIAHMRTWTFVANRPDWLDDPEHWRETTRALEDRLSDALHERLTQRFIDRRTSVLMRRLRENAVMEAEIKDTGEVFIEGQPVGRLQGFQFTPVSTEDAEHGKALRAAASKALAVAIQARAEKIAEAGNEGFVLASNGGIRWMGEEIARLAAGDSELEPRVRLLADDQLTAPHRDWVQARLEAWVRHHVGTLLKPLFDLRVGAGLEGIARGIGFRLVEDLGVLERSKVAEDVKGLDQAARAALRQLGVRFGAYHLFLPATMKPKPRELAALLWALKHGGMSAEIFAELPQLAQSGRTSIPVNKDLPKAVYRVVGYRVLGERAVRVDILERLADMIRPLIAFRPGITPGMPPKGAAEGDGFVVTVEMTSLVGCSGEDFASILKALGYRAETKLASQVEAVLAGARAKAEADAAKATQGEPAPAEAQDGGEMTAALAEAPADDPPAAPVTTPDAAPEVAASPVETTAPTDAPACETAAEAPAEAAAPPQELAPPATVEVWRPVRFDRHHHRPGTKRGGRQSHAAGESAAAADAGEGRGRRPRRPHRGRPDAPAVHTAEAAPAGTTPAEAPGKSRQRPERSRSERFKFDYKPKADGDERPRGPRPQRDKDRREDRAPRVFSSEPGKGGRGPDPDSPFAKLAALKAQMESDKKA